MQCHALTSPLDIVHKTVTVAAYICKTSARFLLILHCVRVTPVLHRRNTQKKARVAALCTNTQDVRMREEDDGRTGRRLSALKKSIYMRTAENDVVFLVEATLTKGRC